MHPRTASLQETNKTQNTREDIVTSVHRIQAAGIEVMAGMIVGFDNDDASIFEEQFSFIQQAHIPISMTGMLNAVPKTPLHARLRPPGDSSPTRWGTSSSSRTSCRKRCPVWISTKAIVRCWTASDYRHYRQRAMALILNRGPLRASRVLARRDDLVVVARIVWHCVLRASPRRAWLTLSLCLETAWRRPRAIRDAFTLALMHKHFYEYVRETSRQLDTLIHELRESEPGPATSGSEPSARRWSRAAV